MQKIKINLFETFTMKLKFYYLVIFFITVFSSFSQQGKDGAGNITVANTIVNLYTNLTAGASAGNTTLTVANTAGYSAGDLVFIIQMQGASVNAGKDSIFPDFNSSIPTNTTYGAITNYNTCGNYEYTQVRSVPNANSIVLDCGLQKNYNFLNKVQVIRVPRYTTLLVSGAGFITAPNWNGTVGGVSVVEVMTTTTLSALPSFSLTGKGFRGGLAATTTLVYVGGGNKFGSVLQQEGGEKGESIAGDVARYSAVFSGRYGRGAFANGGAGGCTHNAGGSGGSNGGNILTYLGTGNPAAGFNAQWNLEGGSFSTSTSSGGGRGGYSFSNANQNVSTVAPGAAGWGGDQRRIVGGFGGRPLDYSLGKLFVGGGGGCGHANDALTGDAGNGGGMVFMLCYGNIGGAGTIVANGATSTNLSICADADGGSGGGGGGTIVLNSAGTINLTAPTALSAVGGKGGNASTSCANINANSYGPGGGGGGGYIATTGALPTNNVSGGANGIFLMYTNNIANNFPPNGATIGGAGSTGSSTIYTLAAANTTICTGNSTTLSATSSNGTATILWYDQSTAGTSTVGSVFTTSVFATPGTYTLYAGSCPGSYRIPVLVTVTNGPTLAVNAPTICAGAAITLTASGATTYTWSTGPNTTTISVNPVTTTVYTISGSISTCSASKTTTVTVSPNPTVTVNSPTICINQTVLLTASGATTYTWSTAATTSTISVTPFSTTQYTVVGANGSCTTAVTSTVTVAPNPTVTASSTTVCPGGTGTLTAGGATTYTWNPGGITGTTYTAAPGITSTYTVLGATGTCTSNAVGTISVNPAITLTVNSPTICAGQNTVLTVSGASTYSWSTGPTTTTISVNPLVNTTYTVTGNIGTCSASKTTAVTVLTLPTVTSNSAAICAGQSATLTGGGATTYTWNPGGAGTSITVSPASTQNYTVTGTNAAGCTNTAVTNVSVTPNPTIAATSATVCTGQTATLTASGATTYTWNPGGITGSSFTITPVGNSTVSVLGAVGSCTGTTTASVSVGSALSISINSPTICAGQTVTLTATSPATSYTWNPGGATTTSIVVTPSVTVSYSVNGSSGACNGSGTTTITVNSNPTVTVNSSTICSGQSTTLTASGATTYTWLPGSTSGNTLTVSPGTTTSYSVIGQTSGCNNAAVSNVTVTITPTISVNSPTICSGSATLTATGATNYTWSPGSATTSSIVVSPTVTASYTINGANGSCSSTATTTVGVTTAPALIIASDVNLGCAGTCVTFSSTVAGFNPITYNFGDGSAPNPTLTTHCYSLTGNYSVTASGTYSTGCTVASANTLSITISASPIAAFTILGSSPFIVNTPVGFNNGTSGTNNYTWYFGDASTIGSTVTSPTHTYLDMGNYCVKLIAADQLSGCKDSVIHCLDVETPIAINIPNIFTPNDDGANDLFTITAVGIKDLQCSIYDRWGLKMYEWMGTGGFWDGKTKSGTAVPNGTYFYIISYTAVDGTTTVAKGTVSLFK